MTETEFAEINREFHRKFNEQIQKTGRPPETCYISQPTWYAVQCYFAEHLQWMMVENKGKPSNIWNGLPVVRVMDENYFELR
jgi:hypothetical protein